MYQKICVVLAIKCWDCSSHINPGCGDPFYNHSFAMVDCDQKFVPHLGANRKATLCRKITQKGMYPVFDTFRHTFDTLSVLLPVYLSMVPPLSWYLLLPFFLSGRQWFHYNLDT